MRVKTLNILVAQGYFDVFIKLICLISINKKLKICFLISLNIFDILYYKIV